MGNNKSKVSRTHLKVALVGALKLTKEAVNGLPIPGVSGCINGILTIIEQEELRKANVDTFKDLVDQIYQFHRVTVDRLLKESNLPEYLQSDVKVLAETLKNIPARFNAKIGKRSMKRRIKSFLSAKSQAKALNRLGEDLRNAISVFQTAAGINIQLMEKKRDDDRQIGKLPVEHKAFYNAHRECPIDTCEPNTRVSLLDDVAKWAEGTGPNYPGILWLNGHAGIGKSTVAKTLASRFDEGKVLGGSFVFSKPNGVTDGRVVFTTLANQLARRIPEFRDHLAAAIRAKEESINGEIARQFEDLLAAPLSKVQSLPVTVIILDALDECTLDTLTPMLTSIVKNIVRFPSLRIVITSRPENPIREVLRRFAKRIRKVNMSELSVSEDIAIYLERRLRNAYIYLMGDTGQNHAWPAEHDLKSLVNMADNLFIFAATVVRFIGDEKVAEPQRRLETIMRGQYLGKKHPLSNLDTMYREILRNALPEGEIDLHERFQSVVGTIVFARKPHSVKSLAECLAQKYDAVDIRHSLKFLYSVLVVPEEDKQEGLQVYHKSFSDFITDPTRCTLEEAYLCPSTHHTRLCFRHLTMAESMFGALPAGNLSITGQTLENYEEATEPVLDATLDMLRHGLHHLYALEVQEKMGKKIEEDVTLAVSYRVEAFLEFLGNYETQSSRVGFMLGMIEGLFGAAGFSVPPVNHDSLMVLRA